MGAPFRHLPTPSHVPAGISMRTPEQAAALHGVPAAYLLQPPSPLQRPLCPQESCGSLRHCACGSGRPAGTTAHSPALPGRAQATQAPVQATLQQTPSAQNPEAQSAAVAHIAPRGRLSHAVPLQHRPRTQRLVVHSLSQAHVLPAAFFTAGAGEQGWTGTSGLVGDPPSRPPAMGMEIEAGPSAPILAPAPPPPGVPPRPSVPTAASAGVTLGSNSTSLVVQAVIATSKRVSCLVVCLIVRPSSEAWKSEVAQSSVAPGVLRLRAGGLPRARRVESLSPNPVLPWVLARP
jgi:hypothetical protein